VRTAGRTALTLLHLGLPSLCKFCVQSSTFLDQYVWLHVVEVKQSFENIEVPNCFPWFYWQDFARRLTFKGMSCEISYLADRIYRLSKMRREPA